MTEPLHRLYSFRRCPYAMRARLGLLFAQLHVELREVVLKNKPEPMLAISPKGTVPVLELVDGTVIDESWDILVWALSQSDPQGLLKTGEWHKACDLIAQNDNEFKHWLDRYKYADRHPDMSQADYREKGEIFLQELERRLTHNAYLLGASISVADIGVMPFVRQFAHVDTDMFYRLPYPNLQRWLTNWLQHPLFVHAMVKLPAWQQGDKPVVFPS
ncbi:glutathione S-transferase [Gilvimarinus sp. SDUM040013]|uniref:Glutathione S-transferase n=1 Tax=Gilvimarinus gilvus TaxID=3058038 RepID=A0ABU4S4W4_9GAMM|nr:glutathione S-transferase [Gilvimarinus sp. SDUM040013]MDO3384390.1 glutathione S-transferase [Gilvimarinus sp. SDUM040013]MDX6851441.1 glutathione S-transferase [Gilvimarinus sp. SDUM040013]